MFITSQELSLEQPHYRISTTTIDHTYLYSRKNANQLLLTIYESVICFLTSFEKGSTMGLGNYANFQMNELPSIYNNISALHSGCSQEQPLF